MSFHSANTTSGTHWAERALKIREDRMRAEPEYRAFTDLVVAAAADVVGPGGELITVDQMRAAGGFSAIIGDAINAAASTSAKYQREDRVAGTAWVITYSSIARQEKNSLRNAVIKAIKGAA